MGPTDTVKLTNLLYDLSADFGKVRAFFKYALNEEPPEQDAVLTFKEAGYVVLYSVLIKALNGVVEHCYAVGGRVKHAFDGYLSNPDEVASHGFILMLIDNRYVVVTGWSVLYDYTSDTWAETNKAEPIYSISVSISGILHGITPKISA